MKGSVVALAVVAVGSTAALAGAVVPVDVLDVFDGATPLFDSGVVSVLLVVVAGVVVTVVVTVGGGVVEVVGGGVVEVVGGGVVEVVGGGVVWL